MEFKAGMFVYALAFLLGIVYVQQLSVLPEFSCLIILLLCFVLLYFMLNIVRKNKLKQYISKEGFTLVYSLMILIILGILYASIYAKQQMDYRFDENLIGEDLIISGQVSSIPVTNEEVQRFELSVSSLRILGQKNTTRLDQKYPEKLRLSWYYGQPVNAGEKWQLEVRLKPPHGFMNPGGFDYEAWLFQHGIHATGYVRKSALNQRESDVLQAMSMAALMAPSMARVNKIRQLLGQKIETIAAKNRVGQQDKSEKTDSFSLIKALAIGDKSSISNQQWSVLTNTGTSHLMAISGLHIGLAALFAYVLVRRLVPVFVMKRIPAQHIAVIGGMVVALLYALIAGLSIPTQRAVIMLFVLSLMMLLRRNHRPVDSLGLALLLVLIIDPLAVLSVGFWFSFSAVAVIFIALNTSKQDFNSSDITKKQKPLIFSLWLKISSTLKQWVRLQLLINLFLLPLSLFMFQQVSLVSPLANLLLIPYVSFLVVPVVLLAIVCSFMMQDVAEMLFNLAASLLDIIWPLLSYLAAQPYALWVRGDVDIVKLMLATSAILLIYFSKELSRFIVARRLVCLDKYKQKFIYGFLLFIAFLLFIPLLIVNQPELNSGEYQVTILDVGQGSAAVIKTQNHVAVFDSGAKFSDRLDAGSSVVIPYLRSQGIKSLDYLIISHGDADHIGGAQVILNAYPETRLIGQDIEKLHANNKLKCLEGYKWHWDGIDFEFLSPATENLSTAQSKKRNNHSCVLQVISNTGSVLFTGDIEKIVESQLVSKFGEQLASDILIVPHHGSKTSSSTAFLVAVNPKMAIFSVGYKNRYKLPNNKVMARYEASNSTLLQTDKTGAVTIKLTDGEGILFEKYREMAQKYWHHNVN